LDQPSFRPVILLNTGLPACVVEAVGDEVAKALELELLVWLRSGQAGLDVGGDHLLAVRIQAGLEVLAARVRLRLGEQAVVQAHFSSHAIGHAHPGDGGLDLDAVGAGRAALGVRHQGGQHGDDAAVGSFSQPVHSMT
jgi:hypothetical protein